MTRWPECLPAVMCGGAFRLAVFSWSEYHSDLQGAMIEVVDCSGTCYT